MIKLKSLIQEIEYPMATKDDEQSYTGYAGWKGKIVRMSPDKFLSLARPLDEPTQSKIDDFEKKILGNVPMDRLVLWIDPQRRKVISHDGRHRAMAAKKAGVESVPVMIMVHIWDKRVPDWTKAQHDFVDKADFKPEKDPDEPPD